MKFFFCSIGTNDGFEGGGVNVEMEEGPTKDIDSILNGFYDFVSGGVVGVADDEGGVLGREGARGESGSGGGGHWGGEGEEGEEEEEEDWYGSCEGVIQSVEEFHEVVLFMKLFLQQQQKNETKLVVHRKGVANVHFLYENDSMGDKKNQ